jgi:hypothetical protein
MSSTPPDHSPSTGHGTSGRHRGSALPATLAWRSLPWRTVGLRSAAGLALVVGAGAVTLGPARLPDGVATPATAQASTAHAAQMEAAALSMRLSDRASRSGRSELLATDALTADALGTEDRARPQTRINPAAAVPAPAPPPAPAPVAPPAPAPAPAPAPTPTPKPTAKPTPTPAPAPKTAAPAAPTGISQAACASGSAVEAGLTKDAIRVHRAVCALFSGVSGWGGRTGSGGEHSTGQALDIMIPNSSVGQAIANYVRANAKALGVSEVIWSQHIWTVQRSGEGWRAMSDRGSPTANHYDHVHVTVYGSSGTV